VKAHCATVPYFLIGTQTDQRDIQKIIDELSDRKQKPLKDKDGKKLAKDIEAVRYMECSAKTMAGYRDIFDEVLRFVINEHKQGKKLGKQCWSIDCRQKLTQLSKVKCSGRCGAFYCADCMEYWEDGFRGCPQCVVYEREEKEKKGKKEPVIKKPRKPPVERIAEKEEKERKKEEKLRKKMEKSGKLETGSEHTEGGEANDGAHKEKEKEKEKEKDSEKEKKSKVEKETEESSAAVAKESLEEPEEDKEDSDG